jgi:hypothetical protein
VYAIARWKLLYEIKNPQTKHGATGKHRGKSQSSNNWDSETPERYTAKAEPYCLSLNLTPGPCPF